MLSFRFYGKVGLYYEPSFPFQAFLAEQTKTMVLKLNDSTMSHAFKGFILGRILCPCLSQVTEMHSRYKRQHIPSLRGWTTSHCMLWEEGWELTTWAYTSPYRSTRRWGALRKTWFGPNKTDKVCESTHWLADEGYKGAAAMVARSRKAGCKNTFNWAITAQKKLFTIHQAPHNTSELMQSCDSKVNCKIYS